MSGNSRQRRIEAAGGRWSRNSRNGGERQSRPLLAPWLALAVGSFLLPHPAGAQPQMPPARLQALPVPGAVGRVEVVLEGRAAGELRRRPGPRPAPSQVEPLLSLRVKTERMQVPVFARLEWRGEKAVLRPEAPLTRGMAYEAVFEGPGLGPGFPRLAIPYRLAEDRTPSRSRVSRVYPYHAVLPANLLKFYLHFTEPMSEGRFFEFARLLDGEGRPISQAFHELELWSEDHRRITVLIHPGRTKRALGLSEVLGPVLYPNKPYTLEIQPGLPDRYGRPLAAAWRYAFRTGDHDYRQPAVNSWKLTGPAPGTRGPLVVRFAEPLDRHLCERLLTIETTSPPHRPLAGAGTAAADGLSWSFVPAQPWAAGRYRLIAGGELEDLAGNSLARPFETAAGKGSAPRVTPPRFDRGFQVARRP
ncbi:MAG: hypothetical protein FJX77_09290 [Armatimonadetes bacterium]|nr:hypothetical protein [Armatimonadota bacterium]